MFHTAQTPPAPPRASEGTGGLGRGAEGGTYNDTTSACLGGEGGWGPPPPPPSLLACRCLPRESSVCLAPTRVSPDNLLSSFSVLPCGRGAGPSGLQGAGAGLPAHLGPSSVFLLLLCGLGQGTRGASLDTPPSHSVLKPIGASKILALMGEGGWGCTLLYIYIKLGERERERWFSSRNMWALAWVGKAGGQDLRGQRRRIFWGDNSAPPKRHLRG